VNNAGILLKGSIEEASLDDWQRLMRVNADSVFLGCREGVALMKAGGGGSIVNIASAAGAIKAAPNRYVYSATKAAVAALTRAVAIDFITKGIRCNAICPGTIETPSMRDRIAAQAKASGQTTAQVEAAFIARQPMGRLGRVEEIAALAVYLASDESSFTTGTAQIIDGGWSN